MKILLISGSARINNNTIRVAKAMDNYFSQSHETHVVDFIHFDIPLMAQGGLNPNALSAFQENLITQMEAAHVIILVSPEYNWSTTPEILNMLHYLPNKPFQHLFHNKVFAFVGVSTGKGGKAPAIHLMQIVNKLISFGQHLSIVSPKIFESHFTKEVLDENGNSLGDAQYDKHLAGFCDYTLQIANRWFNQN